MSADFISETRAKSALWKLFSILLKMGKYLSSDIFFISIQNIFCCTHTHTKLYFFYFHVHVFRVGAMWVEGGMWRLGDNVRSHLHHSSTLLIKQGPSIKPRACWSDWPHQPVYFGICSLPSKAAITGRLPCSPGIRWVLGFKPQSLCLCSKWLTGSHLPRPFLHSFL